MKFYYYSPSETFGVLPADQFVGRDDAEKRSFEGKYASFRNIKFPRGNYQLIVPRHKHSIVFIVHHYIFFCTLVQKSLRLHNFNCLKPACLQKNFHGRALSIRAFSADGHYPSGHFPRTGTI